MGTTSTPPRRRNPVSGDSDIDSTLGKPSGFPVQGFPAGTVTMPVIFGPDGMTVFI